MLLGISGMRWNASRHAQGCWEVSPTVSGVWTAKLSNRELPRRRWAAIRIMRHRRAHMPIMWEEVTIALAIL